jgi:hypothetical protein
MMIYQLAVIVFEDKIITWKRFLKGVLGVWLLRIHRKVRGSHCHG